MKNGNTAAAVLGRGARLVAFLVLSAASGICAEAPTFGSPDAGASPNGPGLAAIPASASVEKLVAPNNMEASDSAFGSGTLASAVRSQLVYGAVHFPPGELWITELRFRPDFAFGRPFSTTLGDLRIHLSTSPRSPDALSSTFSANVGADDTEVFSGSIALSSQFVGPPGGPKAFDIVVPLTTPFLYTPALGSLLVDIRNFTASGASSLSGQGRLDDAASRVVGPVNAPFGTADTGVEALQIVYVPTNQPALQVTRGPYLQMATTSNVVVRWRTSRDTDSRVQFGLEADALTWETGSAEATTEHMVTLTNLAAGTKYFYAVGTSETNLAGGSSDYFCVTLPLGPKPTRIWAIGDSGTATAHLQGMPGYEGMQVEVRDSYYAYAGARETDVWLMLGDNAYLSGTDQQFQETLFDIYPTMLRRCVLWPTIGNHDVNFVEGFPYLQSFTLPTQGEAGGIASGSENYYSFDYGSIHFVCLDSEVSSRAPGGPMLTWLEADLAANTQDWLIAFWHRPPYAFGTHNSDTELEMVQMRENVVPILEAYGVDLVLCGHSHDYERSYLLDGHYGFSDELTPAMIKDAGSGRPDDTGPYVKSDLGPTPRQGAVYVVAGSSGWVTPDGGWGHHPAMFVKLRELGSLVIDVNSNRLDAVFLRETGAIDDRFTLIKGEPPEPLRIATFRVIGGSVRLTWKSVAGQTYHVERSDTLERPDWTPVSDFVIATGATTGWTNTVPLGTPTGFYRVVTAD